MKTMKSFYFHFELGGGWSIGKAVVHLFEITADTPRPLAQLSVDTDGFDIDLGIGEGDYFYGVADIDHLRRGDEVVPAGDRCLQLVSVFDRHSERVAFSEPATVATAYCFAQFLELADGRRVVISDTQRAASIAYAMKNNFVRTHGAISKVLQRSPNGFETNSYAMLNSLSSLVQQALTHPEAYAGLLRITGADSLFGALHHIARNPFDSVKEIYELITRREQLYQPGLSSLELPPGFSPVPNQWTLTIKRNDSGAENFMIAGVAYGVFDKNDRIWIANNTRQGTPNSGTFCVILEPDGSPAPFSPLFGGGLLGVGFGVAVDHSGEKIYFGNYGWGASEWNPQTGSISAFSADGEALSPSQGFTNGLSRVQGLAFDPEGNLWMSSWGTQDPMPYTPSRFHYGDPQNSAIVVFLKGDPKRMVKYSFDSPYHLTFDVAFDAEGNAYVSNSGSGAQGVRSSVFKFRIVDGELVKLAHWRSKYQHPKDPDQNGVETLRQVAVSPDGYIYVVAVASSRVLKFDKDLNCVAELDHNTHGPWGIVFDRRGVMYLSNFFRDMNDSEEIEEGKRGPFGVTVIHDDKDREAQILTLPTGGAPVTLANGLPLYGNPETVGGKPIPIQSFDPLMRLTSSQIDRAGNLWAFNNWKPSFDIDVERGDPGGDGVVIFVGVAAPSLRA